MFKTIEKIFNVMVCISAAFSILALLASLLDLLFWNRFGLINKCGMYGAVVTGGLYLIGRASLDIIARCLPRDK